jgi:hypothetical protein
VSGCLEELISCLCHYCTCLDHLQRRDTYSIISILCRVTQGGQGKYNSECRLSLLAMVLQTNFAIVNVP